MKLLTSSIKKPDPFTSKKLAEYLSPEENRYHHILGVVRHMQTILPRLGLEQETKELLIQSAYLHDVGYSQQLNQYNFHPLDGAVFAQQAGFPKPVIAAVLFHSEAIETVEESRNDLLPIYSLNQKLLDEQDWLFIDLVTYCDVQTSPKGEKVSLDERVRDVVERYGENHPVSQMMIFCKPKYQNTIERVNKWIK
jgi:putative nucleotidyltransferase with HDIG domain